MEINTFQDLVQRAADIKKEAIFNDYISESSIKELIKKQKNIKQIRVSEEDFLTGDKANVVSIICDLDNITYFIMGRWKSFSSPLNPLWFGIKNDSFTDYMFCYPNDSRETRLYRINEEQELMIGMRYDEQQGSLVRGLEYDKKTSEYIKSGVDKINEEIAMDIFNNAKKSMDKFCEIWKEYEDQQLKGDHR